MKASVPQMMPSIQLPEDIASNLLPKGWQNLTTLQMSIQDAENCSNTDALLTKYYLPALYGIIFLVAFPGNIIAIVVYLFKMRPWRSSLIIMLNLAITDLLYLTSLPFLIYYYANEMSWNLGNFMCKFIRFSFNFNLYASILFLTCFSVFRYFAIVHPMRYQHIHEKKWAVVACSVVWVIALVAVIPMVLVIESTEREGLAICLDFASSIGEIRKQHVSANIALTEKPDEGSNLAETECAYSQEKLYEQENEY
ncbi:hypothetical protein NDU88_006129 [Pleurodeles waltl]|uniref:G-protein coupled receptors family 1 profile domain-containing protein n=1 Tax=Pleurodeles waltl TaxID=8319 RepID=A0AAV7NTH5_PLEWA|nr:hypothetical protein NDU88_006129 [Pleurodeles waltl]